MRAFNFQCEASLDCFPGTAFQRVVTVSAPSKAAAILKAQKMGYDVLGEVSDRTLFAQVNRRPVPV